MGSEDTQQALSSKGWRRPPKRVRNELLSFCLVFLFLFTSYSQAFSCIIAPESPLHLEGIRGEDTLSLQGGRRGESFFSEVNYTFEILPSYLTDYIELEAFREIPYSIDYRKLIPEHSVQDNTRSQALVGLVAGITWVGMIAVEHKRASKVRRRYYFSKRHIRVVKRRRRREAP